MPDLRAQWLLRVSGPSGCPYAVFAQATQCGPLPIAIVPCIPLTVTRLALVLVPSVQSLVVGRADQEARLAARVS